MSDSSLPDSAAEHESQLRAYLHLLLAANQKFNLTAVRSAEDAWTRHVVESASLCDQLGSPRTMLDVGSGGGLPGMVLAICRPEISVTLLEATEKKARFLEQTAVELGLNQVAVVCERAETAGRPGSPLRNHFDLVTARAVAPLPTLLELTLPFLRKGGQLLAVKGNKAKEELTDAKRAFDLLGGELIETLQAPAGTLLRINKSKPTPSQYPRRNGEPKHRPL